MNLFGMMETSGEAMQAERIRAEVVAANMANAETTRTATAVPIAVSMLSLPPTPAIPTSPTLSAASAGERRSLFHSRSAPRLRQIDGGDAARAAARAASHEYERFFERHGDNRRQACILRQWCRIARRR